MVYARDAPQVSINISGEYSQCTTHHGDGTVRMVTSAAAIDLIQTSQESWHELGSELTLRQECQIVGDRREPERARAALAGALFSQEASNTCRFRNSAPVGSEHDDDPHPRRRADSAELDGGVGDGEMFRRHPRAPVAANEICAGSVTWHGSLDDVTERSAPVDFDDARSRNGATYRHEASSRVFGRSSNTKGFRAIAGDEGDVGQRLGVVHQRREPADAQWGALVEAKYRQSFSVFHPMGQGGFLSAHESTGGTDENLTHPVVATYGAFVHGSVHCGGDVVPISWNTYDDLLRTTDGGQDLGSVEDEVRGSRQQNFVLVARGVALHSVNNDDSSRAGGVRTCKLDGGGKATAALSREARRGEIVDECLLPRYVSAYGQGDGTQGIEIADQIDRVTEQVMTWGTRGGVSHGKASGGGRACTSLLLHTGHFGDPRLRPRMKMGRLRDNRG
jgi:hypothetical protein